MFGKLKSVGGGGGAQAVVDSGVIMAPGNVVFDGDSITKGDVTSPGNNWDDLLIPSLPAYNGTAFTTANIGQNSGVLRGALVGQGGEPGLIMRMNGGLRSAYNANRNSIVTIWAGTNDFVLRSQSVADTHAGLRDYCLRARAMGFRVVVINMLPRTNSVQATRDSYNALIAANYTTYADVLCDVAADPTIGPWAAASDTNLYGDGIHPTDLCCTYIAPIVLASINRAFNMGKATLPTLWTPYNSNPAPRVHIDASDAVWSGSNLSSIISRGADGVAAMTVAGPPTKGTLSGSIQSILIDADAERLQQTIQIWSTGGKIAHTAMFAQNSVAANCLYSRNWTGGAVNDKVAVYIGAVGVGAFSMWNCDSSTQNHPEWETTSALAPDTNPHFYYGQGGSTNVAYSDGVVRARGGTTIPDATGTVPNYPQSTWTFGNSLLAGESAKSNLYFWALFDDFVGSTEYQKWEGYYAWLTGQTSLLPGGHPWKNSPPTA